MTATLELRLLGGCEIRYGGNTVTDLTLTKAQGLLAYLAISNRSHRRAHLIDLLWTDLSEANARRNLRVVLTKLRQAIGDQLETSRTHVALVATAPRRVDALDLIEAASTVRTAPRPWSAEIQQTLTTAFAAYQGDLLGGIEIPNAPGFEEWMLLERERLRQLAIQVGEQLALHHEAAGELTAAIIQSQQLLAIEPWQEPTQRRLMHLLAQSGQPTAALQQYEQCRRLLAEELGVEPEAATQELYTRIRQQATAATTFAPGAIMANDGIMSNDGTAVTTTASAQTAATQPLRQELPAAMTPFFGRAAELEQLLRLLANPTCRLLTFVGPGGIGKTRLALATAEACVAQAAVRPDEFRFGDGVIYVAATSLPTVDDLVSATAATLKMSFVGNSAPESQLLAQLAPQRLLLIIDNFEHLVSEAARLLHWLEAAPHLTLLITTRERLNLSAEWLFPVEGLPLPAVSEEPETLAENDAIQLFVQRAQRVNLGFSLTAQSTAERTALIAICRLLEGMPLGLELAAAWMRTHNCIEILLEIRANLDFLAGDMRDFPPRHRSLRATFDQSWRLIEPADALLLKRLVLLPVGFRGDFAAQITQATPPALMRLVDKSFLQRNPGGRYTIHQLLRQYVIEQLTPAERQESWRRYVRVYAPWVRGLLESCESREEPAVLDLMMVEFENLRAIWQWLLAQCMQSVLPAEGSHSSHDASNCGRRNVLETGPQVTEEWLDALLAMVPMIAYFYLRRSRYQEGATLLANALAQLGSLATSIALQTADEAQTIAGKCNWLDAQLTMALADLRFHLSEFASVEEMIERILPILRNHEQPQEAHALTILGRAQIRLGQYEAAEVTLQRSLVLFRTNDWQKESAATLNALGILHSNQGHYAKGAAYYEACLAIYRANGYQRGIANSLNNLGSNYARAGDYTRALPLYRESYELAQTLGEQLMLAVALSNLGSVSRALGNFADAEQYYDQSLTYCRAIGERRWTAASLNGLGLTYLEMKAYLKAANVYVEALQLAHAIQSAADTLDALAGLGELLATSYDPASTLHVQELPLAHHPTLDAVAQLLHYLAHHAVTPLIARDRSAVALQQLQPLLSTAKQAEAAAAARELTLDAAVAFVHTPIY